MIHFTNFNERQDVPPFNIRVRTERSVRRVFFPDGEQEATFDAKGGAVDFKSRLFHLHDLAVLEFAD